jgi:hypothetical protein
MFDEFDILAKNYGVNFSVYVDKKSFFRGKIGINSIIIGIVMSKDGMFIPKSRKIK